MARSGQIPHGTTADYDQSSQVADSQYSADEEQDESQLSIAGHVDAQPSIAPGSQPPAAMTQQPLAINDTTQVDPATYPGATGQPTDVTQAEQQARTTMLATPAAWEAGEQSLGYLANRRSAESLRLSQSEYNVAPVAAPVDMPQAEGPRRLKKSSSVVRLSMSSDGKASVTTKSGEEPSPPRKEQVILPPVSTTPISAPHFSPSDQASRFMARSSLKRSSSGRSRDSRAWEFWCDKEARSELEDKADKESSGSAADAISLLRSTSGRNVLGPIPNKRNSLLSRHPSEVKRLKPDGKRPPLQRSNTSQGRLQSRTSGGQARHPRPKLKHSESAVSVYVPGNESDKENWSPDSDRPFSSFRSSQPVASGDKSHERPALAEKRNAGNIPRSGAASGAKTKGGTEGEDADPEKDAEIAAFMRRERKSNSTSSEDDLDCVQGLLSLSQGNWR